MHSNQSRSVPPPQSPGASWRTRLPFFYGWVVVASVFVVMAIGYGVYYSFSVFFVALVKEFGWGRAPASGVFSMFVAVIGVGGLLGGALMDRFGPKKMIPVGGVLLAAGLFATSRVTELWEYYLYFGVVCGIALAIAGWVPSITVVARWFSGKQGVAIGAASAGIGLGTVVMVPLCQYLISTIGWRSAYLVLAGLALFVMVPQAAILLVGRPDQLGLKPDGERGDKAGSERTAPRRTKLVLDSEWASRVWTVSTAVATPRFWLLAGSIGAANIAHQMLFVHSAAYLVDSGYETMLAASVVGLVGFFSMVLKPLWGEVCDRIGRERAFTLSAGSLLLSVGTLLLMGSLVSPWLVFFFVPLFAAGYASTSPVFSTATADLFEGRSYGAIYGAVCIGQGFGSAFGAWVAGYIFDVSGNYVAAFGVAAVAAVLSATCLWLAAPRFVRRVRRGESTVPSPSGT